MTTAKAIKWMLRKLHESRDWAGFYADPDGQIYFKNDIVVGVYDPEGGHDSATETVPWTVKEWQYANPFDWDVDADWDAVAGLLDRAAFGEPGLTPKEQELRKMMLDSMGIEPEEKAK